MFSSIMYLNLICGKAVSEPQNNVKYHYGGNGPNSELRVNFFWPALSLYTTWSN